MAVAVHVGIGVGSDFAHQVKAIFDAVAVEDGDQDEETDHYRVTYEFIADECVDEEGKKNESQDLRERD